MNWKIVTNLLLRKKWTAHQVGLKGKERRENIRNVFALNSICNIQNTIYILFDDVYTTGSTLKEAVKVLKRAGVQNVWGLTVAR
jgi:predicted amidophosphoribosyltransferase